MIPFKVAVQQSRLDDLKKRIGHTRWPDVHNNHDWQTGMSLSWIKTIASYWADDFDWHAIEARINTYPNYITVIDGVNIHYLHIKSNAKNAVPLMISHGWPGSFLEMLDLIPLLTDGDNGLPFDVVVPSLPGFAFSGDPHIPGVNARFIGELWVKLMRQLRYEKFIAQGGDFGALISTHIALRHPEVLTGLHLNYIPFNYKPYLAPGEQLTPAETAAQEKTAKFFRAEGAYAQVQSTKPLTLAYGLNDAPAGLCSWILQIFHSFSDQGRPLEQLFDKDMLLANVTLYWLTGTIYSSMRLYRESRQDPLAFGKDDFVHVPTGVARYPFPDSFPDRKFVERGYNVQYWNDMPAGGHFAAMEQPALFAGDIRAFAGTLL
jgi:pimeloyl-ACP methyl ester carboxylesterase